MKKYVPYRVRAKSDTSIVNIIKTDATKRQSFIATYALIRTRKFTIVISFPGLIQRQGLASWNINILCHNVSVGCCVCIPSILYFNC